MFLQIQCGYLHCSWVGVQCAHVFLVWLLKKSTIIDTIIIKDNTTKDNYKKLR